MENRMQGEEPGIRSPSTSKAWIDEIQAVVSSLYHEMDEAGVRILAMEDNWDGQGARPCKPLTWARASAFLKQLALDVWKKKQKVIKPPAIALVPDGSIDIHWKTSEFDVLVNIPEGDDESATFSADDYGQNATRGTLDVHAPSPVLVYWLVEYG